MHLTPNDRTAEPRPGLQPIAYIDAEERAAMERHVTERIAESRKDGPSSDAEAFFQRMRVAIRGYAAADDATRDEWMDGDYPLQYVRMGTLVRQLTGSAEAGDWGPMSLALADAEAHIDDVDAFTRGLLTVGLLESLQNGNLWTVDPSLIREVRPMLDPVCRHEWDALTAFWEGIAP
ncbi:MAG: hypothetical protein AB1627_10685 [Chloroflexota bacterium]